MKLTKHTQNGKIIGYRLQLSDNDTYDWAHRLGNSWPCSTLAGHKIDLSVDSNGLCDIAAKTQPCIDGYELDACVADHLPNDCGHLWPIWN
jgi:hypothetical protein